MVILLLPKRSQGALESLDLNCRPLSERGGAPPETYVLVDEGFDGARGLTLGCCHRANVATAMEAVGEEKGAPGRSFRKV